MALPTFGRITPNVLLTTPEWKGATVGPIPQEHPFEVWDGPERPPRYESAPAWEIRKGSAVCFLRCIQPARDPYVVTVKGADGSSIVEEHASTTGARERLGELIRIVPGEVRRGWITQGKVSRVFIFHTSTNRVKEYK